MRGLRIFFSSAQNLLAILFILVIVIVAVLAPQLSPLGDLEHPASYKILEEHKEVFPLEPEPGIPLGSVIYYRSSSGAVTLMHFDIFHSLVWGTRSVLRFGLLTAVSAAILGIVIGALSGYLGGVVNTLVMRITDAFLAFPVISGVLLFRLIMDLTGMSLLDYETFMPISVPESAFQSFVLALGLDPVMITLILFSWMAYTRMINSNVIALKHMDFTIAAKAMGAGNVYIIFRHLIPNAITQVIVLLARDIGSVVVLQAAFAFIGISGTVYSTAIPEWSRILMLGRAWVIGQGGNPLIFWWTYIPVTLAFIFFGVSWNMLGDGLNLVLNPRTRYNSTGVRY
jgi:peptide/nickel transport system permease protein